MRSRHLWWSSGIAVPLLTLALGWGCSDDKNPVNKDVTSGRTRVSIPLEGAMSDVFIPANLPTQVLVTLYTPVSVGVVKAASIDVSATLQHVNYSVSNPLPTLYRLMHLPLSLQTAQATIRVGNDPATVCEQTTVYGPYSVGPDFFITPSPDSVELDAPSVQILNNGFAVLCIEITSPVDVTFDIDQLETKVEQQNCEAPANFAGVWTGTYECGNSCGSPFGGDIEITVTQNGNTASYNDGGSEFYTGKVCGNIFRFERIDPDEIERGTLTLDDATHATKRSTWRSRTAPYCSGNCTDILTRATGL